METSPYLSEEIESGQNFRTFFETMDDMAYIGNEQGTLFYTNSAVLRKLGYTAEELHGMHMLDLHPAGNRAEAEQIFAEMFSGKLSSCPLPLARKDGTLVPVETRVWFGKWNGKDCVFGISKDISKEQEALQKFNKLFDNNPALMAVNHMPSRKFLEVNNAFIEITGYSREEVIGKAISDIDLFPDAEKQRALADDLQRHGFFRNIEIKIRTKSGEILDCLFSGTLIESQGKQFFLTVATDITRQKKAEKALAEERLQFAEIIAGTNFGTWEWNVQTGAALFNERWAQIAGYTLKELEPASVSTWTALAHPDDLRISEELLQKHFSGELAYYEFEARMKHKNGNWIWVLDRGRVHKWDENGKPLLMSGTHQDITDRKMTEETLRSQSALEKVLMGISAKYINIPLAEIESTISDSLKELGRFVEADRTYIFEYDWQKQVCNNTHEWCEEGITPQIDELQGVPLKYVPQWVDAHRKGLAMNIPDVFSLPEEDGVRAILEPQEIKSLIAIPLMADDACIGFVGFDSVKKHHLYSESEEALLSVFAQMLVNVKKRAILEKNLIEEKRRAEMANLAKSEFLANMSHEIRTPMNAILGISEALYHSLESPQHRKMINSVLSSGNLLMSLLNDILDLSKIEAGKLEISAHPVNLGKLLNEISLLFNHKAKKKGLEINILLSPGFPKVLLLDEIRIKQIIFNLVGNAIKFTDKGFITILASFTPINTSTGQLQLEVEDTGIGIPETHYQHIFEAFSLESGQSNRLYGGIGLGLAITKRLTEIMNGTISVSSSVGNGSVFKLVLPGIITVDEEAISPNGYYETPEMAFDKASILVVDDALTNIEAIEHMLSASGLTVFSAKNGKNALEKLNRTTPALILLDIHMPGIDGYEVARKIKQNERTKDIPVIAFTASVFSLEKLKASGDFDGMLFKPVKRSDLFNLLARFLKHSTDNQGNLSEKSYFSNISLPSPEILNKLPVIIETLEGKFLPQWRLIKDSLVLFKIEAFSNDLKKIAQEYKFQFLINYCDKIIEDIDSVDLESLNVTLNEFPDIINTISLFAKS